MDGSKIISSLRYDSKNVLKLNKYKLDRYNGINNGLRVHWCASAHIAIWVRL
jgi:hypothetical protein